MSLYAYAVLPAVGAEPARRAAGEGVRIVSTGDLAVAVREVEGVPAVDAGALAAHDEVVRRLAAGLPSIVPLRFGQVVSDEGRLLEAVARARPRLLGTLERLEGCSQVTWRVFGSTEAHPQAHVGAPAPAVPGEGPGARYLAASYARHRAGKSAPPALSAALARLAPRVRSERVERHGERGLIASVYHLVARVDLADYSRSLAEVLAEPSGVHVRTSGPWPPYAFAGGWSP